MEAGEKVTEAFARKASGLVRELGFLDTMLANVAQTAGGTCFPAWFLPYYALFFSGTDLITAFLLSFVFSALINIIYGWFSSMVPRSGGEYAWLTRTLHPYIGFIASWAMVFTYMMWWVFDAMMYSLCVMGMAAAFFPLGNLLWMASPTGIVVIGVISQFTHALVAFLGLRKYKYFQYFIFAEATVAFILAAGAFISLSGSFPQAFNTWAVKMGVQETDLYNTIIRTAYDNGLTLTKPINWLHTLGSAVAITGLTVPFTSYTTYISGEIKKAESAKRQILIMISASAIFLIWSFILTVLFLNATGFEFVAASLYSGWNGLPLAPYYFNYLYVIGNPAVIFLYFLSVYLVWWAAETLKVVGVSRVIMAYSFDRILPVKLSEVHEKYRTPHIATWLLFIISVPLLIFAVYTPLWSYVAASFYYVLFLLLIVSFAGFVFPLIRRETFERLSPIKSRILSLVGLLSIICVILQILVFYIVPEFAASYGGLTPYTASFTVALFGSGTLLFYLSRYIQKRRGIPVELIYKEIPPE
jgi:amino acid transporter